VVSIGVRQAGHVRRVPRDLKRLPLFVLQLSFVMVPIRIAAFATMFHQEWGTRDDRQSLSSLRGSLLHGEPMPETVTAMSGESAVSS
jgi:hypothetical protein